jgi:hypothetical protein
MTLSVNGLLAATGAFALGVGDYGLGVSKRLLASFSAARTIIRGARP